MVKPEVLIVEEANQKMRRNEEQRVHLEKVAAKEPSVRNEVAELRALLLEQERQRAMAQPPSSADMISQVIQGMWAQGLVVAPPGAFPHLPGGGCMLRYLIWTVTTLVSADQHWVEPFYAIVFLAQSIPHQSMPQQSMPQ